MTKIIKITVQEDYVRSVSYALSRIKGVESINGRPASEFDNVKGKKI